MARNNTKRNPIPTLPTKRKGKTAAPASESVTEAAEAHPETAPPTSTNETAIAALPSVGQAEAETAKTESAPVQPIVEEFSPQKDQTAAPAMDAAATTTSTQSPAETRAETPPQQQAEASPLTPTAAEQPHAPAIESGVSRLEQILAQGAKPRKSGRKAFDINLGGDTHTWERVVTPDHFIVFRFKNDPSDEQMALIQKYGFAFIAERKEAHRPNDEEGRDGANKLAWYLKQLQHGESQALAAG